MYTTIRTAGMHPDHVAQRICVSMDSLAPSVHKWLYTWHLQGNVPQWSWKRLVHLQCFTVHDQSNTIAKNKWHQCDVFFCDNVYMIRQWLGAFQVLQCFRDIVKTLLYTTLNVYFHLAKSQYKQQQYVCGTYSKWCYDIMKNQCPFLDTFKC